MREGRVSGSGFLGFRGKGGMLIAARYVGASGTIECWEYTVDVGFRETLAHILVVHTLPATQKNFLSIDHDYHGSNRKLKVKDRKILCI